MATISKRNRGWTVRIRRNGSLPICRQFKSKVNAVKWSRKVERLVELGRYEDTTEAGHTTLGDALNRYLVEKTVEKKGVSQETYKIGKLLRDPITEVALSELTMGKLAKFRTRIAKETSNSTANRYTSLICTCIKTVTQEWDIYMPTNPCNNIGKLKEPNAKQSRISDEQETRLLDYARLNKNRYLPLIITIAIELGLRRSEIVGLRWENVNDDRLFLPDTKNGEDRTVPITDNIKAELDIIRRFPRHIDGRVFGSMKCFRTSWENCLRKSNLEWATFHRLRHEACSRLNDRGFTIPEICAISGHKSWESVKRYIHTEVDRLGEKMRTTNV